MSGSEVSTHPTEDVQKTKRFFSQIKKIEKVTFAKITKFTTFSKEKLLCSKVHLTAKDNWDRFSTPQNWIFRLQLPNTGIFNFCKNSKYRKMVKNCFYRSLRKVESFLFFFYSFQSILHRLHIAYISWQDFRLTLQQRTLSKSDSSK